MGKGAERGVGRGARSDGLSVGLSFADAEDGEDGFVLLLLQSAGVDVGDGSVGMGVVSLGISVCRRKSCGLGRGMPSIEVSWAGISGVSTALGRKTASMSKEVRETNEMRSFSLSTTRRVATLCTRPVESFGRIFFQRTGERDHPMSRSRTRRASCACTRSSSIGRGPAMASSTALFVTSRKVTRCTGRVGASSS